MSRPERHAHVAPPRSEPAAAGELSAQPHMTELTLSRLWQEGLFSTPMRSTDGQRVHVVYRGVWTYSNGPDFRDAMIEINGRLLRGPVELHLRASDWERHDHGVDPEYEDVILHVVLHDDRGSPVLTPGGRAIATVDISSFLTRPLEVVEQQLIVASLGDIGGRPCLPTVATSHPNEVRDALRREGWKRLVEKQLRFQQELSRFPAGEVLYRGILDGLGLMQNRVGMAMVADRVPLAVLEAAGGDRYRLLAMLLRAGGFLPLSPAHAALADLTLEDVERIEARIVEVDASTLTWSSEPQWNLNRVRPVNHPVRRIASLAGLLVQGHQVGLLGVVTALDMDRPASWREWLEHARPSIGRARSDQIAVNVIAPFLAAYAEATSDQELADRMSAAWERLPGTADDSISKDTLRQIVGDARFPIRTALEAQGLHQIGRHGCRALRCFECPIAALAVRLEPLEMGLREE